MPSERISPARTNGEGDGITAEARRQVEICNACRYCEGYCAVFPAITLQRAFSDGDVTQLANLCHNCRGCHYACQYAEPHEFAINLPGALAGARAASWERLAWPAPFARLFQQSGGAVAAALAGGFALLLAAGKMLRPEAGSEGGAAGAAGAEGFYAFLSHSAMVSIFTPAFLLPLLAIAFALRSYWREVGGSTVRFADLAAAFADAAKLKNLSGGAAGGCNFERGDRFSNMRRRYHQAVMYGFLLCFASTTSATILHYLFDMQAPYGLFSLPKLLGIAGGVLLTLGGIAMAVLKTRGDPELGAAGRRGGEMAFVLLLSFTGASGLVLYAATGTALVGILLPLHLGAVLAFFLLMPYSKMAHGFFRLAALVRDAQIRDARGRAGQQGANR